MKIKFLMTCLLGLASATTFAQKGELKDAQSNYDGYTVTISGGAKAKILVDKAMASLKDAKTSIDKASVNEKTANMPQTYALKAAIYAALAVNDTVTTTSAPLFSTADDAVKKAKELDTKNEFKTLIDAANINLAQYKLTAGVKDYQNKKYEEAYKEFDYYRTVLPEDTNAVYYTALSATNAGEKDPKYYQLALTNYKKLVTLKYSGNAKAYLDMSSIYLAVKDTAGALKATSEGITKYPASSELRKREIEIALQSGKQSEVVAKIQSAITNDPKNKELYYYLALTYSNLGDAANAKSAKDKDAAAKTSDHNTALDNYAKATEAYKKALEIDPNYFEANMNLGYVLMRPALDIFNAAQALPSSKQKEYEAELKKSDSMLDLAKPYLQKAVEIKPKDKDALTNLRSYYRAKSDPATAADSKAKAADLKKQIDALQ
ncbi:tetratricopeptide repeat protein [Mucilaginibacter sp. BJC16-A38]|uniref:tetratricopeptide repeat protein n=1 Tax=Mucilaginibacter phenanthrenivorans TaxID=1234842 RepID=UPI0021575E1E|nr:tetratricopeptide repeat protein [Mucilaginibacter phenanthrenivorans]MCR8556792.1 tetratricopeptide repeat protein [Mucilaginibacter phenanthrenivorans]